MAKVLSTSAAKIRRERKMQTDKRLDQFVVFFVIMEIKVRVHFFGKRGNKTCMNSIQTGAISSITNRARSLATDNTHRNFIG